MEEYQYCPICYEVPEREIYQCSAGHIVCNICIAKLTECPQCRARYGATRTRSRVLETLLDSQEFECKFKDDGCAHICRRNEISGHVKTCECNPDLIPLCELLGWKDCKFKLGACSGSDILQHFSVVHKKADTSCESRIVISGESIKALIQETVTTQEPKALLCSLNDIETSPLFFITAKADKSTGYVSFICIQLSGFENSAKYKVKFLIKRGSSSPSPSSTFAIDPLVIGWKMNVYTLREADYALKKCPIGVHIPVLEDCRFGDHKEDCLHVLISQMTKHI